MGVVAVVDVEAVAAAEDPVTGPVLTIVVAITTLRGEMPATSVEVLRAAAVAVAAAVDLVAAEEADAAETDVEEAVATEETEEEIDAAGATVEAEIGTVVVAAGMGEAEIGMAAAEP